MSQGITWWWMEDGLYGRDFEITPDLYTKSWTRVPEKRSAMSEERAQYPISLEHPEPDVEAEIAVHRKLEEAWQKRLELMDEAKKIESEALEHWCTTHEIEDEIEKLEALKKDLSVLGDAARPRSGPSGQITAKGELSRAMVGVIRVQRIGVIYQIAQLQVQVDHIKVETNDIRMKAHLLLNEADRLWAEAVLEHRGNILLTWEKVYWDKVDMPSGLEAYAHYGFECHLETGEVFKIIPVESIATEAAK